jgi:hypothetical protein
MMMLLTAFLSLYFSSTVVQAQADPVIPLSVRVQYINPGSALRNTCSETEIESVDASLGAELNKLLVKLQDMVGLEDIDEQDDHIPCDHQQCRGDFQLLFKNVVHTDQVEMQELKENLSTACEDALSRHAKSARFTGSCQNYLSGSECMSTIMIAMS